MIAQFLKKYRQMNIILTIFVWTEAYKQQYENKLSKNVSRTLLVVSFLIGTESWVNQRTLNANNYSCVTANQTSFVFIDLDSAPDYRLPSRLKILDPKTCMGNTAPH